MKRIWLLGRLPLHVSHSDVCTYPALVMNSPEMERKKCLEKSPTTAEIILAHCETVHLPFHENIFGVFLTVVVAL